MHRLVDINFDFEQVFGQKYLRLCPAISFLWILASRAGAIVDRNCGSLCQEVPPVKSLPKVQNRDI